ncbi:MAG TPA: hypothetical protein VF596_16210 [Pyrinomonadaceae bacterium]|jgi:hypothetical protein
MKSITSISQYSLLLICFLLINLDTPIGQTKYSEKEFADLLKSSLLTRLNSPYNSINIGDVITYTDKETIRLGNINDFSMTSKKINYLTSKLTVQDITIPLTKSSFELNDKAIKIEMTFSTITLDDLTDVDLLFYKYKEYLKPDFYPLVAEGNTYLITETLTAKKIEYRFRNLKSHSEASELRDNVIKKIAENYSTKELTSTIKGLTIFPNKFLRNYDVVISLNGSYTIGFKSNQLITDYLVNLEQLILEQIIFVGREQEYLDETSIRRCKCKDCQKKCNCCPIQ